MVVRVNSGTVVSAALVLSCVYSYALSPHVICLLGDCSNRTTIMMIMAIFPRAVAVGCMMSRAAVMYKIMAGAVAVYEGKIAEYEAHYPTGPGNVRRHRAFAACVAVTCAALFVPVNAYRVHLLYHRYRDGTIVVFHMFMYAQNASMCVTELQFVVYCFGLYLKFCQINSDMSALKSEAIVVNRYPAVLQVSCRRPSGATLSRLSLADSVERLKLRHQFISDAVKDLNALYGVQLGVSLSVLFIMALFDIYGTVSNAIETAKSQWFFYGWVFQYAFRFSMIVLTTHVTTKQALKSKILITDINNRFTDNNTKAELRLFLDELSSRSVEFTTFDMFVINTGLITSAIVTGTTYLVILFQFQ